MLSENNPLQLILELSEEISTTTISTKEGCWTTATRQKWASTLHQIWHLLNGQQIRNEQRQKMLTEQLEALARELEKLDC